MDFHIKFYIYFICNCLRPGGVFWYGRIQNQALEIVLVSAFSNSKQKELLWVLHSGKARMRLCIISHW